MQPFSRKEFLKLFGRSVIFSGLSFAGKHSPLSLANTWSPSPDAPPEDLLSSLKDYRILNHYLNQDILVLAYELNLLQFEWPANKNLSVYSYKLVIEKDLRLEGRNLFIHCRQLIAGDNIKINLTGNDGQYIVGFSV
jgi:hypothetical protein